MNWPTNFWRDKWRTNGACCKSVVILAAKCCFTGRDGFLVVLEPQRSDRPVFCLKFSRVEWAYTKLKVLGLKRGIGHFRLKAQLYTVDLKAMHHQLDQLRA